MVRRRAARLALSFARGLGWLVAGVVLLALALLLALGTTPGRRALLRVALPLVNGKLAGHLAVRGLDGDMLNRVVLLDVRLDDAEGVEAIYARRVEARIDWRAALRGRVHVRDLAVDGARLTLRHLTDNRFNLAALGKPGALKKKQQASPKKPPPVVEIDHFHVQLDGAYHPPRGHESHQLDWPRGTFDIEGAARFQGTDMHFRVDHLVSDARDPLHAHVELRGGLKVTPHGTPVGKPEITFEDVAVTVVSDGLEISRLSPMLHPIGRWQLHAEGGGPLGDLHARAFLSGPRGSVTVDGSMARLFPGVRWRARVSGAGLDPAADWAQMPSGSIDFDLTGHGVRNQGELVVERLTADGGGVHVAAHGHSDFAGHGDGALRASIDSLARLGDFGVRVDHVDELDGSVAVTATLGRDDKGVRVVADARTERLWMRHGRLKVKAARVEAHAVVGPARPMLVRVGGVDLSIAGVGVAGRAQPFTLGIREVAATMRGQPRRLTVDTAATLADGTRGDATLRARIFDHSVALVVDAAHVARRKGRFVLPEPAYVEVSGTGAAPRISARLAGARVDARLRFGHRRFVADADVDVPELQRLARLSNVAASGAARAHAHVDLGEALAIDARLDAERLRAPFVAAAALHARLRSVDLVGDATLDGQELKLGALSLSHLLLRARGTPHRLTVTLDGERPDPRGPTRLRFEADGRWRTNALTVVDADLVMHTATLTLPRQSWRLEAPVHFVAEDGVFTLAGLRARSDVGELRVDGRWSKTGADVTLQILDGDLEELARAVGRPVPLPSARWTGRVHVAGTMTAPLVEARLDARSERTVAWYGFGVNTLSLTAFADARHATVHADARGRFDTRVVVDAQGAPRWSGGRIAGIAATLERVQVAVHGHTWGLRKPCTVVVGARLEVADCRLGTAGGRAELALTGHAPLSAKSDEPLDVTLTTRHLDLKDLHALLAPGQREPPNTDFDISAHVAGTPRAPVADVALSGRGWQTDEGGLPENVDYRITAHYGDGRVRGRASMRQHGLRLGIGATFDLPTHLDDDEQPITLELEARPVPFYKIRQLLPTAIANAGGFFTLRVRASGTTRHPHVDAVLHAPSWGLDNLRDNNTIVNLAYDGRELVVNSVTSFEAQGLIGSILRLHPPRNSGTVTMELRAPLDVVRLVRAPRDAVHALVLDAPIVASAEVRNVDLRKVPLQILGYDAPLTLGHINAAARLGGTLHAPSLHAELRGVDLAQPGVIDHFDVDAAVEWEHGRLSLSGAASLRGAPLMRFRGVATLDGRRLFDGADWRDEPITIDVDVPGYPLSHLRRMQPRLHTLDGTVRGRALVRGSWGAPDLRIFADGRDVNLAHARFAHIDASARLHERRWTFDVVGREVGGGEARVAGELPDDWDRPLRLSIDARALDVGFLGVLWEEIGQVRGTLDAHVAVAGTRASPRPSGSARLDGGSFHFRGDPRRIDAALTLAIDGDEARLTRLSVAAGGGTLEATGRATLDGLVPTKLSLDARAHALEIGYGSATARFDADFAIAGDRADGIFRGQLRLTRGAIRLPDLGGLGTAEELGNLSDVRFDDARARRAEVKRRAGEGAFIALSMNGPIVLRSREADLDLGGELGVTVAGGALGISGVVEAQRGSVELLGHRYTVERAQLAFDGPPDDPELHLRVTRKVGNATVAVIIEGTAKSPSVRLTSEPPVFDQAQLVSLILSGQTTSDRIAVRELDRQIMGLLSAVVIRRIEEQLAPGLPIDVVRPLDQQSYTELSASPIEVGRFVSDRVYVRYEQRYGGSRLGRSAANAEEASAEYRLGRGFQLATSFGDAGVGGVYLLWTTKK